MPYSPKQEPRRERPIETGKVFWRIVGKAIGWTLYDDILNVARPLQASAGLKRGVETVIHAMKEIHQQDSIEGIVLVDCTIVSTSALPWQQ